MPCSKIKSTASWSAENILAVSSIRDTMNTDGPIIEGPTYKSVSDPSVKSGHIHHTYFPIHDIPEELVWEIPYASYTW